MNKTYTPQEISLIYSEQMKQISSPARAVVNCESAFIANRLDAAMPGLGKKYWHTFAMRQSFGDHDVDLNQVKLAEIDRGDRMPSWGTYGT